MKRLKRMLIIALVFGLMVMPVMPMMAFAQTANITSAIPGVYVIPIHLSGQYTASTTSVVRFNLPFPSRVLSVQASARVSGGTSPTLTVDVLQGGATILASPISVNTTTATFGTITTTTISDEAVITVNLTIGGTSPTWNDITVLLVLYRI